MPPSIVMSAHSTVGFQAIGLKLTANILYITVLYIEPLDNDFFGYFKT